MILNYPNESNIKIITAKKSITYACSCVYQNTTKTTVLSTFSVINTVSMKKMAHFVAHSVVTLIDNWLQSLRVIVGVLQLLFCYVDGASNKWSKLASLESNVRVTESYMIRYDIFTCAQKLTIWPALSSAQH